MNKPSRPNLAAEGRMNLSRRRFLRGLGACIALPAFESLAPISALAGPAAAAAGRTAPVRMAFVYVPNGIIPSGWWPEGHGGTDFQLPPTLQALCNVKPEVQLISGLEDLSANPGKDGGALQTGRYLKTPATPLTNLFLSMGDRMGAQGIKSGSAIAPLRLTSGGNNADEAHTRQTAPPGNSKSKDKPPGQGDNTPAAPQPPEPARSKARNTARGKRRARMGNRRVERHRSLPPLHQPPFPRPVRQRHPPRPASLRLARWKLPPGSGRAQLPQPQ
jgi:hypothetical protein